MNFPIYFTSLCRYLANHLLNLFFILITFSFENMRFFFFNFLTSLLLCSLLKMPTSATSEVKLSSPKKRPMKVNMSSLMDNQL